ncbi:MAG: flavodoxin family protein [Methanobrevibacter sp.]|uniref:flavodoxin family protein n=1 Tax=Methanobrevibacter sp. TaxID=66852 RepID=UPI001B21BDFB|nr:flavodoxin family protein [Methanobrevibacter sp.]MBO5152165.1 flavodoxin family protein [Methanobrevibacter sp.]MBO6111368.1 flavodoxin family protein [Methanobrevibacter sp.]
MSKKIIAVNAGPRRGWNTDTLIDEAIKGAESVGAEVQKFHLFRLEKYTGCISCFGCKKEKYKGHCIHRDGLTEILDAIREADGLIIGSPNYLGDLTASFRALYERLVFQNLTYNSEVPCCNENPIPSLIIMTSNAPDNAYLPMLQNYQNVFNGFVGPTEIFVSGETLQLKDYSKTDWPWYFNAEERYERHETIFPIERKEAFEKGKNLVK